VFAARFLDPAVCQPALPTGRIPTAIDEKWVARADELTLAFATLVPATRLNVGTVGTRSSPEGVMPLNEAGVPRTVDKPLAVTARGSAVRTGARVGVRPMRQALDSVVNITVVRDTPDGPKPVDLSGWTFEEERGAMPAGVWDPDEPPANPQPSAPVFVAPDAGGEPGVDLQPALAQSHTRRTAIADALGSLRFDVPRTAPSARFRRLRAKPEAGMVARSA
jgi:hypothetical protein